MYRALKAAEKARGKVSPRPFVGCVIVKDNKIVSEGWTTKKKHAESEALNNAGLYARQQRKKVSEILDGAVMYVTLEPCCHFGKTPPCTNAIIGSGIKKVVIGACDPNPHINGKGIKKLKNADIFVIQNVLREKCVEQQKVYRIWITEKRPFVHLKMALSIDGKIGIKNKRLKLTGTQSDVYVHKLRSEYDAVLIGSNTALVDNPQLTVRKIKGKNPVRIIFERNRNVPETSKIFLKKSETIVINTKGKKLGRILKKLAGRNIASILVEGGKKIADWFLKEKFVDEISLIITPKIIGKNGTFGPRIKQIENMKFDLLGKDILVEGQIIRNY